MSWVTTRTGVGLSLTSAVSDLEPELASSVSLALRRNPLRAHLLVSSVLGKHVPVRASLCLRAGQRLAEAVAAVAAGPYDVIGFAETATGLGHQVAHGLGAAMYVHTTRRPGAHPRLDFLEEHSHATQQALTPAAGALDGGRVAVLVDDEISTGRTALNAIAALAPVTGHRTWVLATLLDTRSEDDRQKCDRRALELGITLLAAVLLTGEVSLPGDGRTADVVARVPDLAPTRIDTGPVRTIELRTEVTVTARRSFTPADDEALRELARTAAHTVGPLSDVLVVGDEELMYFPQLVALELGDAPVCSTTRSPVVCVDADDYPVRTGVVFDADSEPGRRAFSYNTVGAGRLLLVTQDRSHEQAVAALAAGGAEVCVLVVS